MTSSGAHRFVTGGMGTELKKKVVKHLINVFLMNGFTASTSHIMSSKIVAQGMPSLASYADADPVSIQQFGIKGFIPPHAVGTWCYKLQCCQLLRELMCACGVATVRCLLGSSYRRVLANHSWLRSCRACAMRKAGYRAAFSCPSACLLAFCSVSSVRCSRAILRLSCIPIGWLERDPPSTSARVPFGYQVSG